MSNTLDTKSDLMLRMIFRNRYMRVIMLSALLSLTFVVLESRGRAKADSPLPHAKNFTQLVEQSESIVRAKMIRIESNTRTTSGMFDIITFEAVEIYKGMPFVSIDYDDEDNDGVDSERVFTIVVPNREERMRIWPQYKNNSEYVLFLRPPPYYSPFYFLHIDETHRAARKSSMELNIALIEALSNSSH